MDYSQFLPYALAVFIAIPFLLYLKQFVSSYIRLKEKELKLLAVKSSGENRIVAYERMTLFLERLKPSNLVTKFSQDLKPHEFIFLAEKSIQEEFDYNASQQLFISKISWQNISAAKNSVIQLLHKTYEGLGENPSLEEFKTVFLMNYVSGEDYLSKTVEELRKEILFLNL